jgi:hypothetical protein
MGFEGIQADLSESKQIQADQRGSEGIRADQRGSEQIRADQQIRAILVGHGKVLEKESFKKMHAQSIKCQKMSWVCVIYMLQVLILIIFLPMHPLHFN